MAKWRIECQSCKHAHYYYGGSFACENYECEYEPCESTATTQTNYIDSVTMNSNSTKGKEQCNTKKGKEIKWEKS